MYFRLSFGSGTKCQAEIRLRSQARQNAEKKDFSLKCCLLAFISVALGPVVSYNRTICK